MEILGDQRQITKQFPQPVDDMSASSSIQTVSGETVQLYYSSTGTRTSDAGQAAGTAVTGQLANKNILDAGGGYIATLGDTSLAFTCAALTTERAFPTEIAEAPEIRRGTWAAKLTAITNDYAQGEYCIDYRSGTVYGVKKTTATSMASTSYKINQAQSGGSTSVPSSVNISKIGGVAVIADDAAFTPATSTGIVAFGFADETATDSVGEGDVGALRMTLDRKLLTASNQILGTATYTEATTYGNIVGAVRNDTLAALANTDNEIAPLQVNASGALYTEAGVASGGIASGAFASGSVASGAVVDGAVVTLGTKTDDKSTATDTTAVSAISLLKEISYMEQTPASRAVTNAGTFAVQSDIAKIGGTAVAGHGDSVTTEGLPVLLDARSSQATAVTAGQNARLISNLYGELVTAGHDWSAGVPGMLEKDPISTHYGNNAVDVDTTNVSAATHYYPSATGASMNGYKGLSITGKLIDADETLTVTVEASNDEDTTNADWEDVTATFIDTSDGAVGGAYTVTNGTLIFGLYNPDFNFTNYRIVVVAGGATNTVILKARVIY